MSKALDTRVIERIQAGDADAFGELYNAYIGKIYRYILFKVPTHEEAEDLAADVFLRAWQHLYQQQRPVHSLNAFLYQVAKNIVIDFYRGRAQSGLSISTELVGELADWKQQRLFQQVEQALELANIERSIRQLKDEYKDVVLLRYVEELSVGEIAHILGKSRGTVRVMIYRALKVIRDHLKSEHPTLDK